MFRLIGNLLWFLLAGWTMCIAYLVAGLLLCVTIIGIPFGVAAFRLAFFVIWPFGRMAVHDPNRVPGVSMIANILSTYWTEVKGNVYAILPCAVVAFFWVRAKHTALVEAHQKNSKHLEHLLKALDPEEETDNMLDRIADKVDETTPGGIESVLKALQPKGKAK